MDKKSSLSNYYYKKYIKYKEKYLKVKNQKGGNNVCNVCTNQQGGNSKIDIILFKADWCGHCKRFASTWEQMQQKYKNKYNFITIDSNEKEQIKNWNIRGFPTIYVKNKNTAVEYEGSREEEDIIKFVNDVKQAKI
jgi:thiol-disulfide isomerase/thioredoxin